MSEDTVDELYRIGFQRLKSGDFAGSLEVFTRAEELCPNDHEIIHFIGVALMRLGRNKEAAAKIERALDLFPEFPDALADLGDCLADLGRTADAQQAYRRGLQFAVQGEEVQRRIALALQRVQ